MKMRSRLLLGAAALWLAGMSLATADDRGWGNRGGGYGRDRGGYGYSNPVPAVLRDVQYVWSRSRVDGHERDHFRKVVQSLEQFQDRAARGHFDRGRLDRAINNLEDLAQAHQIHPQGRRMLTQRLYDLRAFREDGGRYYR
ncbi:MAG: hypothetical protein IT162_10190 [Bryobacterales bacterium]|nr:hypothetical protein [Bryobacterales bacterium]